MVTSKQLLPVYDKPMIYYPLSILMLAGINEILIISTPADTPRFESLLGNGHNLGIHITYKIQETPDGISQAFILGEDFIGNDCVCLILGDNIFYGNGLKTALKTAKINSLNNKATIFGYHVDDPKRFGVVEFNQFGKVVSITEKPINPKSNYAVTGLYFYDNRVVDYAKKLKPSIRGELEITDLNKMYLDENNLEVFVFGRGLTWLDTGTHESLAEATAFVKMIEEHQGLKISCPEEIAFYNGWITKEQLLAQAESMKKTQ
jgi:glucose-1-phosphate thymidylyltransferase